MKIADWPTLTTNASDYYSIARLGLTYSQPQKLQCVQNAVVTGIDTIV